VHRNDDIDKINSDLVNIIPGEPKSYKSVDSVEQVIHYPIEFINALELSGVPPHNLVLKVAAPIMLKQNLDPPKLCNRTRLASRV